MNKKVVVIPILFLLPLIASCILVSAAPDPSSIITNIQEFFKPVLISIFGEAADTVLFEQLLFALLIIAAIYMALDNTPVIRNNSFAMWTITIVTTILAVRYIATEQLLNFLLFPQGVLGVALLTIIPFAIYFWFIEFGLGGGGGRVLRRAGWAVYAAAFSFLWYREMYSPDAVQKLGDFGYMYLAAAVLALILLLADGTIQGAIAKSKTETHIEVLREREIAKIRKKMERATEELSGEALEKEMQRLKTELDSAIKMGR